MPVLPRGMADLSEWRLGGRDGAGQFWAGYVNAVRQAAAHLACERVPPLPLYAPLVHGEDWARRVEGYALDLVDEALTMMEESER